MNSRILFLDYDGVVNTPMWNKKGSKCRYNFPEDNCVNNFQAVQWVSEFCQRCEYDIVVISSWRTEPNYKECLINGGLRSNIEILGCTDDLFCEGKSRGEEVESYLNQHPEIKRYVIVDDINDFLPDQQAYLVEPNPEIGFCRSDMQRCVDIHMKWKNRKR